MLVFNRTGVLLPLDPGTGAFEAIGPFEFTGGTGPFASASGGGNLHADIQFLDPTGAFGISTIQGEGTLVCPDGGITLGLLGFGVIACCGLRRTGFQGSDSTVSTPCDTLASRNEMLQEHSWRASWVRPIPAFCRSASRRIPAA